MIRPSFLALALIASGCSIAPNTQDLIHHLPTHQIAHRVRCEARVAIRDNLTQWLDEEGRVYPQYLTISKIIKTGTPEQIKQALYNGPAKSIVQTFADTAIAYSFTFDATETNKIDPAMDLIGIFHRGSTPTNVTAGYDRSRENIETFLLTDKFSDLLLNPPDHPCEADDIIYETNFSYPLMGNVGLGRVINEFTNLTLFDHLSGKDPRTRTYGATLKFSTAISLSGLPKVVLTPVGMGFHLADASLGLTASRVDVHTLDLGLALAAPTPAASRSSSPTASPVSPAASSTSTAQPSTLSLTALRAVPGTDVSSGLFINVTGSAAERLAAHVIDQQILRFQVGQTNNTIVVPSP